MSKIKKSAKAPTKKPIDPRIANVLARLDDWQSQRVTGPEEAERFMDSMLQTIAWSRFSPADVRKALAMILAGCSDAQLDALDGHANDEHRIYLECTVGTEAAEALERCGLSPREAELLAQKTIGEMLAKRGINAAGMRPEVVS